jgi:hypothetical protein
VIGEQTAKAHIMGMAAAGIVDRRVVWMKGYGYADLRLSARLEDWSGAYPIATTR